MLIGRAYRKSISQTFAYAAFKWLAVWLIIAACSSKGQVGIAAGLVIVAVDIIAIGNLKATLLTFNEQSNKDWHDRLTNRCFYKLLFDKIRAGNSEAIDVDELFRLATQEARADIKQAGDDAALFGYSNATAWHWFGGIAHFLGQIVFCGLYYGSALYLGSAGSF